MPDVKIKLGLDNRVKPGQQTVDEIVATLQGQGHRSNAANVVRDPVTGKLLRVEVNLPDTAAAAATAAINANAGVATATVPLPPPLLSQDVTAMALATLVLIDGPGFARQLIAVHASTKDGFASGGNVLLGFLSATGYVDINNNPNPSFFDHTILNLNNSGGSDAGTDLTLPVDDLTITVDGNALLIDTVAPITVVKKTTPAGGASNTFGLFIDNAGKLYPHLRVTDGVPSFDALDYDTAVANPPA